MNYTVRVLYRFVGSEKDRSEIIRVTAKDSREAQSQARMVWLDTKPPGIGVQWLGCCAEPDTGQMSFL